MTRQQKDRMRALASAVRKRAHRIRRNRLRVTASTAVQIVSTACGLPGTNGQGLAVKNSVANHSQSMRSARVSVKEPSSGSVSDGPPLIGQQKMIVRRLGKDVRLPLETEMEVLGDVVRSPGPSRSGIGSTRSVPKI